MFVRSPCRGEIHCIYIQRRLVRLHKITKIGAEKKPVFTPSGTAFCKSQLHQCVSFDESILPSFFRSSARFLTFAIHRFGVLGLLPADVRSKTCIQASGFVLRAANPDMDLLHYPRFGGLPLNDSDAVRTHRTGCDTPC